MGAIKKFLSNPKVYAVYAMGRLFNGSSKKDEIYLNMLYKLKMGKKIDFKNPKTFNEKQQWMKAHYYNPLYTQLADKYAVREYIKEKIGEEYLIPLLGVYDKFDDIDFDKLPNQFVIKCNHDSGGLVICKDKAKLDKDKAKIRIESCLKRSYYLNSREWVYRDIKPKIIIEQYMENENKNGLIDYKFFCFDGKPEMLYVSEGLEDHSTAKISFLTLDFQLAEFKRKDYRPFSDISQIIKPEHYDEMLKLAGQLAQGFPFIRVDLYEINDKIYFSEFTFFPCSGMMPFDPEKWDETFGSWYNLPERNR